MNLRVTTELSRDDGVVLVRFVTTEYLPRTEYGPVLIDGREVTVTTELSVKEPEPPEAQPLHPYISEKER